ncbi:hypothetical protein J3Q30_15300 [Bordetella holmesii]|nr:hypothetical protein H558_12115 [Bordetella holmesii H558]AMD50529.1 hypothetical protein F783_005945 [Bordetella holmesii F627]MBO1241638.1 hypothetical protein [Bordetella holmesii]MBO1244027.1 hypothetical protein [Bordetella holmesii]MBO1253799.1 hypothetical protein [Bordetella holmesii]
MPHIVTLPWPSAARMQGGQGTATQRAAQRLGQQCQPIAFMAAHGGCASQRRQPALVALEDELHGLAGIRDAAPVAIDCPALRQGFAVVVVDLDLVACHRRGCHVQHQTAVARRRRGKCQRIGAQTRHSATRRNHDERDGTAGDQTHQPSCQSQPGIHASGTEMVGIAH